MRTWTNKREIDIFFTHKKTLEQQLAREILNEFNQKDLIEPLRKLCIAALARMLDGPDAPLLEAAKEERLLFLWNKKGVTAGRTRLGVEQLQLLAWRLTASEVSDVIRLYGAWIEKAAADKECGAQYGAEAREKESLRKGKDWGDGSKGVWDKGKYRVREWREDTDATQPFGEEDAWLEFLTGRAAKGLHPLGEKGRPFKGLQVLAHGISLKQAVDKGVLGRIENVFGLKRGAAISGTTTDTIHFLKHFGAGLDPLFLLLPIGTMVFNYHHALVEVAMALTINDLMDYSIGFYTSLMPRRTNHRAKARFEAILKRFEARKDNKLILVHYGGGKIGGCYQFEAAERDRFRRLAKTDKALWQHFARGAPTQAVILALMMKHGLGLGRGKVRGLH